MQYIHGKGMQVGIRPIFFVVDAHGNTPYVEILPDGTQKVWWHGNIQPANPNAWFDSFQDFLDIYLPLAKLGKAEEFTLGAELYSMTVGVEDQWKANPYGFPGNWLSLLKHARGELGTGVRIMYDVNFTDDKVTAGGIDQFGGEFERWRYRLVDLANPADPAQHQIWQDLVDFWTGLDAVGLDVYRSLATVTDVIPTDHAKLVALLQQASDRYATQIDNALFEIQTTVNKAPIVILKEIGFRSVDKGFIDPFKYAGAGHDTLNIDHQAAAYEAIFRSFWAADWAWFKGLAFWDASVDNALHGPTDTGFSPIGKAETEAILKQYFLAP
jgi:hypothetical protein